MSKTKGVILIFAIVLAVIATFLGISKSRSNIDKHKTKPEEDSVNYSGVQEDGDKEDIQKEITIYDIEDGYLTVQYNPNADTHQYNWNKLLVNDSGLYQYEDDYYRTRLGIDVSSYQGTIDWKKVKNAGIEFAILRLGFRGYGDAGKIVLDKSFEENYINARKEGIDIGVYFFSQAINNDEINEEVEFIVENLKGKEITYPVFFDLEKIKNDTARTDNLTLEEITDMTLNFCRIIKEKGYEPGIYGNAKTFTMKMKLELFNDYQKWYADYQEKPLYPYDFSIWQYTEKGRIDGISGNVDIDIEFIKK